MSATLIASTVLRLVAAAVFVYIGYRMAQRVGRERSGGPGWSFVVWWGGVAGFILTGAIASLASIAGVTALGVFITWRVLSFLALCVGIIGLLYYLFYLYTGRRGSLVPVAVFYTAVFVALMVQVFTSGPFGVDVQRWRVDLVYESPLGGTYYLLLALLILPTTVGAMAYFALFFRTQDRLMRLRIALVSWSIAIWGLSSLLARIAENDLWQMFTRAGIGLLAALVILFAYEPPARVRERLAQRSPPQDGPDAQADTKEDEEERQLRRARKQKQLQQRLKSLV